MIYIFSDNIQWLLLGLDIALLVTAFLYDFLHKEN